MTNKSPGKPPIPPEKLSMIFQSSDFAKLMESNDMDLSKLMESSDSAKALFRSADFLKSLDAYKDHLAQAPATSDAANNKEGPSAFFRSVDFLKSLDSLPKDMTTADGGGVDYSSYFASVDTLPKDFLKSLDSLPREESAGSKAVAVTAPVMRGGPKDLYTSRDWMGQYGRDHVDVSYDKNLFQSGESGDKSGAAAKPKAAASNWMKMYENGLNGTASSKAKPAPAAAASSNWKKMYETILKNPKPASTEASAPATPGSMPPLTGTTALAAAAAAVAEPVVSQEPAKAAKPKKKRVYKSRKVIPEVKTFVEFTDDDVLLGRGGLSNKHPGNKRYRQEIENAKPVYRAASKEEKTKWAQLLVDYVQKYGGRFLEKDKATNQWYIVPDVVARRKAGQALREDNTPESRAEKRERYKRSLQNKSP